MVSLDESGADDLDERHGSRHARQARRPRPGRVSLSRPVARTPWQDAFVPETPDSPAAPPPPQHCPTPRELDDLQLLASGALGTEAAFTADGPLTLTLPAAVAEQARAAGAVELVDPEGLPLARLGTADAQEGPDGAVVLAGVPEILTTHQHGAFRRLYLSPADAVALAGEDAVTVPVAAALTEQDLAAVRERAAGRPVLLLALAGHGTPQDLSAVGLIRATLAAAEHLDGAHVVAVPLAARDGADADADHTLGQRVVDAYAPGEVVGVTGRG